jgi:tetratricopeptide (TPR) repeat protein
VFPFFVLAGLFLVGRFTLFVGTGDFTEFPGGGRLPALLTAVTGLATYLRLIVLPANLHVIYDFPVAAAMSAHVAGSLAIVAVVLAAGAWLAARRHVLAVSVGWFFVVLLPVINVVIPFWILVSERYLYLVLPGVSLAVAWFAGRLIDKRSNGVRIGVSALLLLIPVALAVATVHQARTWESSQSLWTDNVAKAPGALDARYNLGVSFAKRGESDAAIAQFKAAVDAHPDAANPRLRLAAIYRERQEYAEAVRWASSVLEAEPDSREALLTLGYVHVDQGQWREAREWFEKLTVAHPEYGEGHAALAAVDLMLGDRMRAFRTAHRALRVDEHNASAYQVLGHLSALVGEPKMAASYYADMYRYAKEPAIEDAAIGYLRQLRNAEAP